ncbi:MAG: hypothetical protein LBD81_02850 [Holosporaceae bacterium]|jgi:hypothetical protein|nr:hypothetical protein [Holosporaceae bacterium]
MMKVMMLLAYIAIMCGNSVAMYIELGANGTMEIHDKQFFDTYNPRCGPITIKEFYEKAAEHPRKGGVNGLVNIILVEDSGKEEKVSIKFSAATFLVVKVYSENPNEVTLRNIEKFACAFVPLLYWNRDREEFNNVAKKRCSCGAHDNIGICTKFIDESCDSGVPFDLEFKLLGYSKPSS